MDSNMKPSTIMLIGGGVVLFISTFLDWVSVSRFGANAWDTDLFGLLGIFCAVIGIVIGGGIAASEFGNVSMPDKMIGFGHDQIHLILSTFALLITFGFIVRGDVGIGLILGLLASGVMVAGSFMDMQASGGNGDTPPTQF